MMRSVLSLALIFAGVSAFVPTTNPALHRFTRVERLSPLFLSTADFKNGLTIEFDGAPWKIIEFLHVKPGKGSAFVRSKLKNLLNGNTQEKTWRAGESMDAADVNTYEAQYTYDEGENYVFMNMETFEEARVPTAQAASESKYFKEGMELKLMEWNGKVIAVQVPATLELKVVETEPGVKGNTAQGVTKPATLETGAIINVPGFIDVDEVIKVNTEKDEYLGRVNN